MRSQIEDYVREVSSFYVQHEPVDLDCSNLPSQTRQEFAAECDINTIMAGYEKTGVISHMNRREPMYVDLTDMPDNLADTLQMLEEAKNSFMSLPAKTRAEFENDPVQFVNFASDPANIEQLREWGLAKPAEVPAPPMKVEVVNPADASSAPAK